MIEVTLKPENSRTLQGTSRDANVLETCQSSHCALSKPWCVFLHSHSSIYQAFHLSDLSLVLCAGCFWIHSVSNHACIKGVITGAGGVTTTGTGGTGATTRGTRTGEGEASASAGPMKIAESTAPCKQSIAYVTLDISHRTLKSGGHRGLLLDFLLAPDSISSYAQ